MTHILRTLLFIGILFIGHLSVAKNLENRLGAGYADPFHLDMPSVHLRYWPSAQYGFSASLGVDTEEDASRFGLYGKLYKIIFAEDNLNFYMGAGLGIISREELANGSVDSDTGYDLSAVCGVEYFFSGLDSVGFTFEAGAGITSIDSEVRFRTIGQSPLSAGMVFYF